MTAGVPVIVSRRGALPEVAGDAAQIVEPDDVDGLAAAMRRYLDDPAAAAAATERGLRARAPVLLGRERADAARGLLARRSPHEPRRARSPSASTRASCSASRPASAAISASCCAGGRRGPTPRRGGSCSTRRSRCPSCAPCPTTANVREVVAGSGRGTWWEQTHLRRAVRSDPPDVFFAGAYTAPLALGVPLAVTIHDVSFAAHPEWFRPREGARRRLLTRQAARAAEVVFTDSEFSRGEILERLSVAAGARPRHSAGRDARARRAARRASRWCSSSDRSSTGAGCRR